MAKKRGWNLKKGEFHGRKGRERAHRPAWFKEMTLLSGDGTTHYRSRAKYGSRKGVKRYKPREK